MHRLTIRASLAKSPPVCRAPNSASRIIRFLGETQIRYTFEEDKTKYGVWLREELTHMGPAFIKLGQLLSTRTDLFERPITAELEKLQDDITPVPYDEIVHILEEALPNWRELFSHVDPTPLACASIGQVHSAVLKQNSAKVVIKLQKPCVAGSIRQDLITLEQITQFLKTIKNERAHEVESLIQQYDTFLSAELDYQLELKHMKTFTKSLEGLPVRVPRVYEEYSSDRVLVMEYVPSIKITDISQLKRKGVNCQEVAKRLIEIFLHMMVYDGPLYVDCHPGNIGVLDDLETLVLYDYGNVVYLSKTFRQEIGNLVFSIYQRDVDEFVDILLAQKIVRVDEDDNVLDIREFFHSFFKYLETMDFVTLKSSMMSSQFGSSVGSNIKIDPDFLSLFRVFSLLDGTCSRLDPDFNYIEAITPFAEELMGDFRFLEQRAKKDIAKLQTYPSRVQSTDQNVLRVQRQLRDMNSNLQDTRIFCVMLLLIQLATVIAH